MSDRAKDLKDMHEAGAELAEDLLHFLDGWKSTAASRNVPINGAEVFVALVQSRQWSPSTLFYIEHETVRHEPPPPVPEPLPPAPAANPTATVHVTYAQTPLCAICHHHRINHPVYSRWKRVPILGFFAWPVGYTGPCEVPRCSCVAYRVT